MTISAMTIQIPLPLDKITFLLSNMGWTIDTLDREEVAGAISNGLDDLCDADRRREHLYHDRLDGLTVEDAELAHRIKEALQDGRAKDAS